MLQGMKLQKKQGVGGKYYELREKKTACHEIKELTCNKVDAIGWYVLSAIFLTLGDQTFNNKTIWTNETSLYATLSVGMVLLRWARKMIVL